ncbi:hypothetical protein [Rhodoblastus sp.]|uniref:hypothetical protein n=1 Tax=Rhodoblastus sp. TaxID=1962975 RepID=UPI003F9CD2A1
MDEIGNRNPPRWEWRTFGARLSDIEAKVGLAAQVTPRQSDEIYLLNSVTPHSAKIRGGVLEVKRLLLVDSNGLEQWSPVFKAPFPLSAPMVRSAFAALELPPPDILPGAYGLGDFLAEVASKAKILRPIQVTKARRQFVFCNCVAEFVRLDIGPVAQESLCIEDENPSNVLAALRELGLDPRANISFPKGIERALVSQH